jgi:hypothetical protein
MFDAAVLSRPLPEGSFFALLAEHGDRIVRDEDFAECYSSGLGRPSIPPALLAKVMLLQHRTGASDEQAMEAVAWDLRWKVALGLPVDHQGWHPTSLTKYRARLLLHKKEGLALQNTLRLAGELGMLDGTAEQIIDSTPMLGAAATQDTVRLVRHGVKKLIGAVETADPDAGEQLARGLEFDYARPGEKPDCRWREKAERERMLTRVAQDAERALAAVERSAGLLDDDVVKAAHELLRELIGQDFDIDQDGVPRLHRGTRSDRIISTIDTEMRHGRKSSQQRFDGYKLSAAATNSPEPLITAVHIAPGGQNDGPQAKHLIESNPTRACSSTSAACSSNRGYGMAHRKAKPCWTSCWRTRPDTDTPRRGCPEHCEPPLPTATSRQTTPRQTACVAARSTRSPASRRLAWPHWRPHGTPIATRPPRASRSMRSG